MIYSDHRINLITTNYLSMIKKSLIFSLMISLSSCMTYRNIPDVQVQSNQNIERVSGTLTYKIEGGSLFAGPMAVRNVISNYRAYTLVQPSTTQVNQGDFLDVNIAQTSPSIPAVVFGYLSFGTLTILPFWSSNDGSVLTFSFFRDGQKIKSKEYVISRGTFVWIVMLPLAWVNLITPSESDAFEACAKDFLQSL